jgi:hypothetical protein
MHSPYSLVFVATLSAAWASPGAAAERPEYTTREDVTGSNIRRTVWTTSLPMDKTYVQLDEAQKGLLKSQYLPMDAKDEPPFPVDGLGKLFTTIGKGAAALHTWGNISVILRISSSGEAVSAAVLAADDEDLGRFAAQVGMLTRFKPAICNGQACAMDFPIRINFEH